MASGVLGTASSALLSFQRNLATTGHNIANVNTEGYSRQRVELGTQVPQQFGAGYIGNGVKVETIQRHYDDFLERQLRASIASRDSSEAYLNMATEVDNLLADEGSGLGPMLERFFSAVQDVANDPTSIPARQLMLSEGDSLVESYHYLDNELGNLRDRINVEFTNVVGEINNLTQSIAKMNSDIALATGSGSAPNDLLDKRDQLILELSSRVAVSTVEQSDGSVNVFMGNGQGVVIGQNAGTLSVQRSRFDSQQLEIGFAFGGGSTSVITDNLTGGKLGGLIDFRDQVLDPAQNELGQIAVSMAQTFNDQHDLGVNLDGALGSALPDFYSVVNPQSQVFSDLQAGSTATATLAFDTANIGKLTADEYKLNFDGTNWIMTNLTDNSTVTGAGATPTFNDANLGKGITVTLAGAPVAGDEFLLRPTRQGADGISLGITNPRQIAAASPIRISEATGTGGIPTNTGTGEFSSGTANSSFSAARWVTLSTTPVTLTYNAGTFSDGTNTFAYNPATQAGNTFSDVIPSLVGIEFTISGTPSNGDQFTIAANSSGVGDNRNMLQLAGLQTSRTMNGGTASYQDTYGQLIADVGVKTRRADTLYTTQSNLADNAQMRHDEVSAVNLDEEAAELVRFQQAYQAAARVIVVSDQMFQTLLNATGR